MKRILALVLAALVGASPAFAVDINGYLRKAALEPLSSDPSTTLTGRVYFNTTTNGAKVYTGTAWQGLGGSGAGEKNYLATGTNSAAGWTSSDVTKVTCTTSTTNLPDASVGTALAVTGQSGAAGTEYCFYNFDIDQADGSKVLKLVEDQLPISGYVASDFRLDVYSCTVAWSGTPATTCSGTATRLALSTDNSSGVTALPALTGTLTPPPTYSTPAYASAPHLQARIGLNGASTHQMNFAQVLTGPGTVVQSAAISNPASYTPNIIGVGTATNVNFWYRQVGSGYQIWGSFTTGTVTAANLSFTLPNGYTIDSTKVTSDNTVFGVGTSTNGVAQGALNDGDAVIAFPDSGDYTKIYLTYKQSGTAPNALVPIAANAFMGSSKQLTVGPLWIPVSEIAGQGTVFLGQGVPAYYYCTGGTWGTSSTCTTQQGQGGVLGGNTIPSTSFFSYTFTPTAPPPAGAVAVFEASIDGTHWSVLPSDESFGYPFDSLRYDDTNYIGAAASITSSGQIKVYFGKYVTGTSTGARSWNGFGTWYWRVFVGYPGQATGFAAASATAPGLVSYESGGTVSGTWTGPCTTSSTTVRWARTGQLVSLTIPSTVNCGTCAAASFSFSGSLPTAILPAVTTDMAIPIEDNGTNQTAPALVRVTTGGALQILKSVSSNNFTAAAAQCGMVSTFATSYPIN